MLEKWMYDIFRLCHGKWVFLIVIKGERNNSYAVYQILSVTTVVNSPWMACNSKSLSGAYVCMLSDICSTWLHATGSRRKGQPRWGHAILTAECKAKLLQETQISFGMHLPYDSSTWIPLAKASHILIWGRWGRKVYSFYMEPLPFTRYSGCLSLCQQITLNLAA